MTRPFFWMLCLFLQAAAPAAQAAQSSAPAHAGAYSVRMPFHVSGPLLTADGSAVEAFLDTEPAIRDGAVVAPQPWPNVIDIRRYASKNADSVFHFTTAGTSRRIVRIDINRADRPGHFQHEQTVSFRYDAAGNLTEQSVETPATQEHAAVVESTCFAYDASNRLAAYARRLRIARGCAGLDAGQYDRQYVYNDNGDLERVIEHTMTLQDGFDIQSAIISLRVTAYDTAGKPVATFGNPTGPGARVPPDDKSGSSADAFGIVGTDGAVTLGGAGMPPGATWSLVQGASPRQTVDGDRILAQGQGPIVLSAAVLAQVRAHPGRVSVRWPVRERALYPALSDAQWQTCIDPRQRGMQACGISLASRQPPAATVRAQRATARQSGVRWAVQEKFAESGYAREFANWQDAFAADARALLESLSGTGPKNTRLQKAMADDSDDAALATLFTHSIADTPKGRSLKRYLIAGWSQAIKNSGAPKASSIFIRQVLGNPSLELSAAMTLAVGYGGSVADGDHRAEVMYILPMEFATLRPGADAPSRRYQYAVKGLGPLALPPFGVATRNVWPTMLFVRSPRNTLLAYAMTQEMNTICERLHAVTGFAN
jgi:hypothetical protein